MKVGPHGTGHGSSHGAATDDSQDPRRSEPDSHCFVSFTLFSLLLEGQFCFVLFYNVRLPCSSFNFLIECIYRCPFLYFFFNCDLFWLNVITAVFQKKKKNRFLFTIPHVSSSHARAWQAGGRSASRDPGTLMAIVLSCWALHLIWDIASQQSGHLDCSVIDIVSCSGLLCMPPCCWPGGICSESPVHHLIC